ncbi:DUF4271 domain-containing protein [Rhodoflexus caldus]|uniref:DUF4271 domain-containing protein n=1 Tax=Rhodoflexus caldus TaxID=2891236 RepID=UPI00202A843A|nr:DUF4271 domain-containing protein [Rhodoflexus caldus]
MGKRWCSYWIGLLWMSLVACNAFGQSATGLAIYEDISHRWLIYDYNEKIYVPYLPGIHPPTRYLHVVLQPQAWQPARKLVLPVEKETLLFINNNLSHYIRQPQTMVWDLDSLAAGNTTLLLTYAFERPIAKLPPLFLGEQQTEPVAVRRDSLIKSTAKSLAAKNRPRQTATIRRTPEQKNYLLVVAVACSVMLAAFSLINPRYVSIKDSLQSLIQLFKYREVQEKTDFNALLVFAVMFAALATYLLMLVAEYSTSFAQVAALAEGNDWFIGNYLKIGGWLMLFLLLKYLLIELLHGVFAHRTLAEKHIAISFNIYKIFILLIFALFTAYHLSHYYRLYISPHILYYSLIWGWVTVTALTGLVLYLSVPQRFIYLIAYLCTTEVLPLLLVLKLFLIPS